MTSPAPVPSPQPAPVQQWPSVFDGVGALVVRCDFDPHTLLERVPNLTWVAVKMNGTDIAPDVETAHCIDVWRSAAKQVGGWVYNYGPPSKDVTLFDKWLPLPFVIYNVEVEYKADEGGHYEWAQQLVAEHTLRFGGLPAAVTSYGGYKSSLDFGAFSRASWPILAQVYDWFHDGDEVTYRVVYPDAGIHRLTRRLTLQRGESVYRPESSL